MTLSRKMGKDFEMGKKKKKKKKKSILNIKGLFAEISSHPSLRGIHAGI